MASTLGEIVHPMMTANVFCPLDNCYLNLYRVRQYVTKEKELVVHLRAAYFTRSELTNGGIPGEYLKCTVSDFTVTDDLEKVSGPEMAVLMKAYMEDVLDAACKHLGALRECGGGESGVVVEKKDSSFLLNIVPK